MVTFIIIRHGYSKFNKEKRFTGQLDVPLDEKGIIQAEYTAKYILSNYKVDKIYSSDLSRACETVKPLSEALGLPIITDRAFREIDVGIWQGELISEIEKKYPDEMESYRSNPGVFKFEGGENYSMAAKRASEALETISKENDGKTIAVATHGGIVRCLRCLLNGYPLEKIKEIPIVPNASVTVVSYDDGNAEFLLAGYNEHLPDKISESPIKPIE